MKTAQVLWLIWCCLWAGVWAVLSWAALTGTAQLWQDVLFPSMAVGSRVAAVPVAANAKTHR